MSSEDLKNIPVTTDTNSVLFAVDLHKVLIEPHITEIIKLFLSRKYLIVSLLDPRVWYHIIKDGAVPEKIVDAIDRKYKDKGITKKFLVNIVNCQYLNKETVSLFEGLKNKGYDIYLASNAWEELFLGLQKKFSFINTLFKGYYIPTKENNYIEKPDERYYQDFKRYLSKKGDGHKTIIFIDNSQKNVEAAKKEGLIGIVYQNKETLVKDLKQLRFEI